MDRKRDGPKFEVGDRVRLKWTDYSGNYLGTVVAGTVGSRQCASLDDYKAGSGPDGSYPIGGMLTATLVGPATEPAAQEDVKFKKGDRVEVLCNRGSKWAEATYVKPHISASVGYHVVERDDRESTEGDGFWYTPLGAIRLITTEPVAAQKETKMGETTMKAYQGLVRHKDEAGAGEIAQHYGYALYGSEQEAKMGVWAKFTAENKEAELRDYQVDVAPFGG